MTGYGERLATLVAEQGPLCAGIDPHPGLLTQWGLPVSAHGLERCARTMVETLADLVPVFKPQSAFFELHGAKGIAVLERVLADLREAGALSLLDVKRGDIGSTMDAYAAAYLADGAPLAADAITVSPYLGFGSLTGAIELAEQENRGVYVLALTSNAEGRQVQHARTASGRLVAEEIVAAAAAANSGRQFGNVGLVVGATIGRTGVDLTQVHGSLLAPGIGAQGGAAAGLSAVFGEALPYVLPSASRELMGAGPDPTQIRDKAEQLLAQMRAAVPVG
jgi:orotidine-5'-phosphate decarboxylase